ncbi:MAG: DUF1844 domain-containing protein [Elusimicrobia bacterium HGW-Elusimicrobia-2]|nr:MAG: DUF1844 domain-containing protein [Elusimicrobia bacterium HGW-Elusimicrobia-2]
MDSEFFALVLMFQQSVMLHLGKMSNPSTGKAERNLVQAKMSVDILEMLNKKTKGNLDKEEEKFLANVLADAQLNYASEAAKTEAQLKKPAADTGTPAPDAANEKSEKDKK